jgi:glycosyltransferase involved in cell wall biosynthesis
MRILQIDFSLGSGGAERLLVDLSNELSKNHEVFVCTILSEQNVENVFYKKELFPNVTYINLNCNSGINGKAFFSIIRLIKKLKPDVVHGHLNVIPYMYLPALLFDKVRFIHTIHSLSEKYLTIRFQKQINRFFYKRFIKPVTISDECMKSFEKTYNLTNSIIIKNGRNTLKPTENFLDVKRKVDEMKIHHDDLIFLHIGRWDKSKNQSMLVDVFNELLCEGKHLILIIIGTGFENGGGLELRKTAHSGIFFLGLKQNVSDFFHSSDFFCLSSEWEGLPISLLESMACGVIPICTPVGGIPDVINNDNLGYLAKSSSKNAFKDAVIGAICETNKIDRSELVREFMNKYSIEKCANEYIDVYSR